MGSLEAQFFSQFIAAARLEEIIGKGSIEEQKEKIRQVFASKNYHEWNDIFIRLDACVEPVLTLSEAVNLPHRVAREMLTEVPDGKGGSFKQIASAFKLSESKAEYKFTGVEAGSHTDQILPAVGMAQSAIDALRSQKVIA